MSGFRVENPATGEVLETFDHATDQEILAAVDGAHEAFLSWRDTPIEERAKLVTRVAELFEERKDELAEIIATEMGKPVSEGLEEAEFSGAIFAYYADNGPKFAADEEIPVEMDGKGYIQRLPIGTLLGIMPWNFPYYQVARFAAPNLMLGNTIVLKHATICPRSALAIQKIMDDAGVPKGVYTNIFATHEQAEKIIEHKELRGVSLTGSERAGAAVGSLAAKNLKKAVLELGGSDPYVILDTDDVKQAAKDAWETRMYNTGQACNSNKRLIVMEDIYDEFVAELVELAKAMKPGTPQEASETVYTPLSSRSAAENLKDQIDRTVAAGATLHVGGELVDEKSSYFSPAVLTDVPVGSDVYYEELFGPVATVFKVSSDEEALELANDTQYGLGGCVFSKDVERAEKIAQRLEVGMSNVNTYAAEGAEVPFGGVKNSGYGRELGPYGMDEFVNKRTYFVAN
ncbi:MULTISPECIES: NAD-dependent succinate-semialdehyde dehydrogenase [unclassified Corynebacterium]|uniref:NAD-dependent succinate-semialdehyde dehydrogenase n=1 Tax=unclassified Corynebacterium TaxID=2624378 RepID=UPI0008A39B56|nr:MULTISPECIES: NAD-dependent succinate-semialdehyde dehydrogenase [unclassified Corynebacterium]OFK66383.1 succinate-semialdehyde dehydrogenase [Corynebacterium sp. HMSC074A09]OFN78287.1 succinate-semialdehyde dehydrogenase [Corynebacterium sp. HMSC074E01]OFP61894.1 succinate-semialdehyde dehydrogenase [Corynebacterium sp. HMSC074C01]OHO64775.1 succinate-semialdehyde dehydrogenase [Corynebacterium sp. HMSC036D02]